MLRERLVELREQFGVDRPSVQLERQQQRAHDRLDRRANECCQGRQAVKRQGRGVLPRQVQYSQRFCVSRSISVAVVIEVLMWKRLAFSLSG